MMKIKFLALFLSVALIGSFFACSDKKADVIDPDTEKPDPSKPDPEKPDPEKPKPEDKSRDAQGRVARWTFDKADSLLYATVVGNKLVLNGTHKTVDGPKAGDGAVEIGIGSYYKAVLGLRGNGGGSRVNEYTLMFDVSFPNNDWKSFFTTDPTNKRDGECYISPQGEIGLALTGYTDYSLKVNEWYRVVMSVKLNGKIEYYVDGDLVLKGKSQGIDGDYSLGHELLFFADEDGEDGTIRVAEIGVWDKSLTAAEIKTLGGYGHKIPAYGITEMLPYLQQPDDKSMVVCWHDRVVDAQKVEYGTSPNLGQSTPSVGDKIADNYIWHTAKLTNLTPNTEYFYRIVGKAEVSEIYSFKTQPAIGQNQKMRFLLIGDTQQDPFMTSKVIQKAKEKMEQLYGNDLHKHINFVINTGDITQSGFSLNDYMKEHFRPMAQISATIPSLNIAGNHEQEMGVDYYYRYMYHNDVSGPAAGSPYFERYWSKQIGNTLFVGLNSTNKDLRGEQLTWLKNVLTDAENNASIDFVFCFIHETPLSELWDEAYGRNPYIKDKVLPILQAHRKVEHLSYGHVHAYERGMVESRVDNPRGDITLLAGGGGGGNRDYWGEYRNFDHPEIMISYDYHFFTICEIDMASKSYKFEVYSLGNDNVTHNSKPLDTWERSLTKAAPNKPTAQSATFDGAKYTLKASDYVGVSSQFSAQYEVAIQSYLGKPKVLATVDKLNIYGVDSSFNPINLNKGVNLLEYTFDKSKLTDVGIYVWRVRYRDVNRKWSQWSDYKNL